jgi:hypothetical protein
MPTDVRPKAELDYLRAKAKWKLERQMARRARDEERRGNRSLKVDLALLVIGLLLLIIGVSIVMHNNPWRTSPGLTPVTTTPTTVSPRGGPGECGYPHSDECGYGPTTTPPQIGSPPYCAEHPNDWVECGGGPGPTQYPTTTTSPFPTEMLCDVIRPRPPKCPPTTTPTITPGVTV